MRQWVKYIVTLLFAVLMGLQSHSTQAEPFPTLDAEDAAKWAAVGQVNAAGFKVRSGCTGTLIAPDLVATAAHCVQGRAGLGTNRFFVAGWNRGDYVAGRASAQIIVHPQYVAAAGVKKYFNDVALIVLESPIEGDKIEPVPLMSDPPKVAFQKLLLGYHRQKPHVLSGSSTCRSNPKRLYELIVFDCEVVSGNSGGPVLHKTEDGWVLAAVIVARAGEEGHGLAVPVDDWMRGIWQEALQRAHGRQ